MSSKKVAKDLAEKEKRSRRMDAAIAIGIVVIVCLGIAFLRFPPTTQNPPVQLVPTSAYQPMEFEVLSVAVDRGTVLAVKSVEEGTYWTAIIGTGYYAKALQFVGKKVVVDCWRDQFDDLYTACEWVEFFDRQK